MKKTTLLDLQTAERRTLQSGSFQSHPLITGENTFRSKFKLAKVATLRYVSVIATYLLPDETLLMAVSLLTILLQTVKT